MRELNKTHYNHHGNIKKCAYKTLDHFDEVGAWLMNWTKSHKYAGCYIMGSCRARCITKYLTLILGIDIHKIQMPEQIELVYNDFELFKTFINHVYAEGKINQFS